MDALYQRDLDEFGGDDANQEVPPPPASDPTQHPSWSSPESESPPLSESPPPQSLAPPEFSQQREDYAEPPSPIDLHNASIGAQSHASVGSIGEDIDVNSQGLVEETLERRRRRLDTVRPLAALPGWPAHSLCAAGVGPWLDAWSPSGALHPSRHTVAAQQPAPRNSRLQPALLRTVAPPLLSRAALHHRLGRERGVLGVLIIDSEGRVIRTTMDERTVAKCAPACNPVPAACSPACPGYSLVHLAPGTPARCSSSYSEPTASSACQLRRNTLEPQAGCVEVQAGCVGVQAGCVGVPAGCVGVPAGCMRVQAGCVGLQAGCVGLHGWVCGGARLQRSRGVVGLTARYGQSANARSLPTRPTRCPSSPLAGSGRPSGPLGGSALAAWDAGERLLCGLRFHGKTRCHRFPLERPGLTPDDRLSMLCALAGPHAPSWRRRSRPHAA